DKETEWKKEFLHLLPDTNLLINVRLRKLIEEKHKSVNKAEAARVAKTFPKGAAIFKTVCQACHGVDGNGINSLAPPLQNSNWVLGNKNKLISIVLYGLTGPVTVGDKVYKAPEINGEMPGIESNEDFKDEDIAQVLSFIRNSWGNKAEKISADDITNIRKKYKNRQTPFTIKELEKP
ncbi:MAG: cytochrome c, partial [Ginsengibacter sp.]